MNFLESLIFGVVQGVTEFLPVSSSGHLVLLHNFLPSVNADDLIFDVALHFATLLALIIYFRGDLAKFFLSIFKSSEVNGRKLAFNLIYAIIPTLIAGSFFEDFITNSLRSPLVVVYSLIAGSLVLLLAEKIKTGILNLTNLKFKSVLAIGLIHALSLIPGFSRSGAGVSGGLLVGLDRKDAVRFSFLMAIPLIFIVFIKKLFDLVAVDFSLNDLLSMSVAMAAAFFSGLLTIRWFLKFVESKSLYVFVVYRLILAGIVFILVK